MNTRIAKLSLLIATMAVFCTMNASWETGAAIILGYAAGLYGDTPFEQHRSALATKRLLAAAASLAILIVGWYALYAPMTLCGADRHATARIAADASDIAMAFFMALTTDDEPPREHKLGKIVSEAARNLARRVAIIHAIPDPIRT